VLWGPGVFDLKSLLTEAAQEHFQQLALLADDQDFLELFSTHSASQTL
jgi:hypothetical protein